MSFDELYQEIILDHYRHPRHKADLAHVAESDAHANPTCGDILKLEMLPGADGRLSAVRFDGRGCAISTASASMMCGLLEGKTLAEAAVLVAEVQAALRSSEPLARLQAHGDLAALAAVARFPLRVKCALLAWNAGARMIERLAASRP